MRYRYRETEVVIPRGAEVSRAFLPSESAVYRNIIQEVLDDIEPWEAGEDPIETFDLPQHIGARVAALTVLEVPAWGINPHHRARNPGLSPYKTLPKTDRRQWADTATLELAGTVDRPQLVRVYPGDYMPPLPWMITANKAPGGYTECVEYWETHAFIKRGAEPQLTATAPDWYKRES
jgi:hypothetical protein